MVHDANRIIENQTGAVIMLMNIWAVFGRSKHIHVWKNHEIDIVSLHFIKQGLNQEFNVLG